MHKKLWNKDFILLLQGNVVSALGDLMYSVAIGYWVYEKTGSSALMGIMSAISMFVTMFLSPFSGSIVDKCNRKWVIVGVDILQGVLMLTVGILAHRDILDVPGVLAVAFIAAFGNVFYNPAVSTLMIDIIPHDHMVQGQSIYSSATTLLNLVGSAFSGAMVAFFGVPLIVLLNGLSNLYSAASELFIRVPKTAQQGDPVTVKGVLRDTGVAVKTTFFDRYLRLFVPCALIINLLGAGPLSLLLPFTMEKGFGVEQYGYLMTVWTAASLLCVVVLGAIRFGPRARYAIMTVGFCTSAAFLILGYNSARFVPLCIWAFLAAMANVAGNTVFNASYMLALPEENRGAILGFFQAASVGGSALSAVIYGVLGDVFPLYLVFTVGNLLSMVPMLYLCLNPKTREFVLNH